MQCISLIMIMVTTYLWHYSAVKEMAQIKYFQIFRPLKIGSNAPDGHTFVPVNMCFDVKFDLSRNSRLVAGGNMKGDSYEVTYCDVVKIDTVRADLFLGQINDL